MNDSRWYVIGSGLDRCDKAIFAELGGQSNRLHELLPANVARDEAIPAAPVGHFLEPCGRGVCPLASPGPANLSATWPPLPRSRTNPIAPRPHRLQGLRQRQHVGTVLRRILVGEPLRRRQPGAHHEVEIAARHVAKIGRIEKPVESRLAPQIAADEPAMSDKRAAQGASARAASRRRPSVFDQPFTGDGGIDHERHRASRSLRINSALSV